LAGFSITVRVYYEDTDAGGMVYHANYLKFMERARTEWLRALGYEQDTLIREEGRLFAVRSASVNFIRPARLNDLLEINAKVSDLKRASVTFEQQALLSGQTIAADGVVRVACLDAASLRPRSIPENLRKELSRAG
jgi:acyl-CoA thioester hydrolase